MTGQAVSCTGWGMDATRLLQFQLGTEELETVALEAEVLRVLIGDPDKIAGVRIVTGEAVAVSHRGMQLCPFEIALLLRVTTIAERGRFIGDGKGLRHIGFGMTALTVALRHRLVSKCLEQLGIIRRMDAVTGGTTIGHRVTTVSRGKRTAAELMAPLAQLPFILDQQLVNRGAMGFMTGAAPLRQRRMNKLALKSSPIMTIETELFQRLVQQLGFWGVMMLVTGSAVALLDRAVQLGFKRQFAGKRLVTAEAELRPFDLQVSPADQTVLSVTAGAITAFYRLVHHPFVVEVAIFLMTVETGLAPFGRRRPGRTGLQTADQQRRQNQRYQTQRSFRMHVLRSPPATVYVTLSRPTCSV